MTTETDLILDRRRLSRRLFFWRIIAILGVVLALVIAALKFAPDANDEHVAKLTVENVIIENDRRQQVIQR